MTNLRLLLLLLFIVITIKKRSEINPIFPYGHTSHGQRPGQRPGQRLGLKPSKSKGKRLKLKKANYLTSKWLLHIKNMFCPLRRLNQINPRAALSAAAL